MLLGLLFVAGCSGPSGSACAVKSDCFSQESCVDGRCQSVVVSKDASSDPSTADVSGADVSSADAPAQGDADGGQTPSCEAVTQCIHGDGCCPQSCSHLSDTDCLQVEEIAAGAQHSCARLLDGSVHCWGWNESGQLGDATLQVRRRPTLAVGLEPALEIAAGWSFTCARHADLGVSCWGHNSLGQLGQPVSGGSSSAQRIDGLVAVEITTGNQHACARLGDGTVQCWGDNRYGQLGDTTKTSRHTPGPVAGIVNAVEIAAGGLHTCARLASGSVQCWGRNFWGQLGDGTDATAETNEDLADKTSPVSVRNLSTAVEISAAFHHSCARLADHSVQCWGSNEHGKIGAPLATSNRNTPQTVPGLTRASEVATGRHHTCARLSDGTVWCWGLNAQGQLGDQTLESRRTPAPVPGLNTAAGLAAGNGHTCVRLTDASARCFGDNIYGQLGNDTTAEQSSQPVELAW
ncbi:MAG: hypothetical protein H0U74_22370 [Bradymonadaceae bacterium]|nr:hypothetical protein [Lujinxingiaceae bacterium]